MSATLNVGGVFLYALLERHSFENTQDCEFAALSATFVPSLLLVGTVLVIIGSFFDRRRLPTAHRAQEAKQKARLYLGCDDSA
jgi:hypothetical protein